jgi:hypothetical protein
VKVVFYAVIPYFGKSVAVWEVTRLCPFALVQRNVLMNESVWSTGGMTLTGEV